MAERKVGCDDSVMLLCHRIWRFDGLVFGFDGWIVSRVGADSEVQLESKSTCDAELGTRIDSFFV